MMHRQHSSNLMSHRDDIKLVQKSMKHCMSCRSHVFWAVYRKIPLHLTETKKRERIKNIYSEKSLQSCTELLVNAQCRVIQPELNEPPLFDMNAWMKNTYSPGVSTDISTSIYRPLHKNLMETICNYFSSRNRCVTLRNGVSYKYNNTQGEKSVPYFKTGLKPISVTFRLMYLVFCSSSAIVH